MQIYLQDSYLYGFNRRREFETRCIAENILASQKYKTYNKNKVKHKNNIVTKN